MKTLAPLLAMIILANAHCQDKPADPAPARPLKAEYTIYSGGLGDEQAPTKTDRKLSIEITGQGAKDIFDSLYPDAQGVSCSSEKGERLRKKGHVWCAFSPNDGYRCFLGVDLRTGASIAGGSC